MLRMRKREHLGLSATGAYECHASDALDIGTVPQITS